MPAVGYVVEIHPLRLSAAAARDYAVTLEPLKHHAREMIIGSAVVHLNCVLAVRTPVLGSFLEERDELVRFDKGFVVA